MSPPTVTIPPAEHFWHRSFADSSRPASTTPISNGTLLDPSQRSQNPSMGSTPTTGLFMSSRNHTVVSGARSNQAVKSSTLRARTSLKSSAADLLSLKSRAPVHARALTAT